MGYNSYEKHYLFKEGPECCSKFFPSATNCPYKNTAQTGYYWEKYQDSSFTITLTILLLNQRHVSMGKLRRLLILNISPNIIFLIFITDASLSLLKDRLSKVDGLKCRLRASLSFQDFGRLL